MQKSAYITLQTDNTGFTFVKNHEKLPYWLVDQIEAKVMSKCKVRKGKTRTIGKVIYDNSEKRIVETIKQKRIDGKTYR